MENYVKVETNPDNVTCPSSLLATKNPYYAKLVNTKTKWYHCIFPSCSKIFRFKSEIEKHIATHSDNLPYYCTFEGCNKSFKRIDTLETHLRAHDGLKPFECGFPGCGQKFASRSSLNYHSIKHKNTKVYKCQFLGCDKSFLTQAHLKQHEKALFYHKKLSYNQKTLDELKVTSKKQHSAAEDCQIIESSLNIDHNRVIMNETVGLFPNIFSMKFDGSEYYLQNMIEGLRKENELLKKSLEIKYELQNHIKDAYGTSFQYEQQIMLLLSLGRNRNILHAKEEQNKKINFFQADI